MNVDLAAWLDGPGHLLGEFDDLVREPGGWVDVLDPSQVPDGWLPWLAQFAGVRLGDVVGEAAQRQRIFDAPGQRRGTVAAVRAAARRHLTGSRSVTITERTTDTGTADPYHVVVTTFLAETPDAAAVEAELEAAKPAGLIFHYDVVSAITWQDTVNTWTDWTAVGDDKTSWQQLLETLPEEIV